jgi:hypothetical protein
MIWVAVIPHPNASPMSFENTSAPLIDEDTVAELLDACWEGEEAAFVVFWSRATAFLRSVTSSLVSMRETQCVRVSVHSVPTLNHYVARPWRFASWETTQRGCGVCAGRWDTSLE